MSKITVSVIIATYNSGKLLPMVLKSLSNQTFPRNKMEIIFMDGGSKDNTKILAKKYKCKVFRNPRTEPVYGKFIGFNKARGQYVMYLDHDEVLKNKRSIENKVRILEKYPQLKAIAGGNYINPKNYPFINEYINEFGDPFSFFIYKLSKRNKFFLETMKSRYKVHDIDKDFYIFDLSNSLTLPIIELVAGGSMLDAAFLKKSFPETKKKFELIPHFYYLIHKKKPLVAVAKNDPILHYSSDILGKYLNKIRWRVKNNIFHTSSLGASGFSGREEFQPTLFKIKKYLYLPYAFSVIPAFLDATYLAVTRKNLKYYLHVPLTLYTALTISYYLLLKILGVFRELRNYDESVIIK